MSAASPLSVLAGQLPSWVGGPLLGACVVLVRVAFDDRLGVSGALAEVV